MHSSAGLERRRGRCEQPALIEQTSWPPVEHEGDGTAKCLAKDRWPTHGHAATRQVEMVAFVKSVVLGSGGPLRGAKENICSFWALPRKHSLDLPTVSHRPRDRSVVSSLHCMNDPQVTWQATSDDENS